jgi:hypothetical protein
MRTNLLIPIKFDYFASDGMVVLDWPAMLRFRRDSAREVASEIV